MRYADISYDCWESLWCQPILIASFANDLKAIKHTQANISVTLTSVIEQNSKEISISILIQLKMNDRVSFFTLSTKKVSR